jgi:two-component sensor histidine kinase
MHNDPNTSCGCETGLYVRELAHRTANGLQQAIAAVHLVRRDGMKHVDSVMDRLAGIAEVNGLLASCGRERLVDLVDEIETISAATARSLGAAEVTLMIHGEPLVTTSRQARPLLMAVAELVSNSIRHGLGVGGGSVAIDVFNDGVRTEVLIEDDGRCHGWNRSGGQGHGIVDALAASLGGTVSRKVTALGSGSVALSVPTIAAAVLAAAGNA